MTVAVEKNTIVWIMTPIIRDEFTLDTFQDNISKLYIATDEYNRLLQANFDTAKQYVDRLLKSSTIDNDIIVTANQQLVNEKIHLFDIPLTNIQLSFDHLLQCIANIFYQSQRLNLPIPTNSLPPPPPPRPLPQIDNNNNINDTSNSNKPTPPPLPSRENRRTWAPHAIHDPSSSIPTAPPAGSVQLNPPLPVKPASLSQKFNIQPSLNGASDRETPTPHSPTYVRSSRPHPMKGVPLPSIPPPKTTAQPQCTPLPIVPSQKHYSPPPPLPPLPPKHINVIWMPSYMKIYNLIPSSGDLINTFLRWLHPACGLRLKNVEIINSITLKYYIG
ncbi:hypothetical protein DFA_04953 [Cavenderia fasciculata]|uniref:Uncharacterized protein n=1 Tax=Cavenderia fasciculata TaxID=261658 RepID=F4PMM6_CACFS|nr:uncharacterized protein DFA_04953 [Cavenderia fasciculata]EGG22823.1 hypothetical protein DFA_04953 [Cavenderia fasciculata]|eukprot:XP_004360674.1 hypothetical protein DFA_04953 [Cavenderia fasciculata]